MTKTTCHRSDIDVRAGELGRGEMTEIVKPHAQSWTNGLLDLRPVRAQRGRRKVDALSFTQPPVQELPERGAESVGVTLAVPVDEVTRCVVGGA